MARNENRNSRLVYSTESGRTCPACNKNLDRCICSKRAAPAGGDGIVRVGRSTKGRKGKGVTLITVLLLFVANLNHFTIMLTNFDFITRLKRPVK